MTGKRPFAELVSLHGPTVLRVCRAVVGPHDADDAWSEAFLSALRAYPQLPEDANVEAWLVTIAHRKAIDLARRAERAATPVAELPDRPGGPPADAAGAADGGGELDLAGAMAELTDRQRDAVVHHYIAGLPYAEVAAVIGGSTDAARRAAADGIARLRALHDARPHPNPLRHPQTEGTL